MKFPKSMHAEGFYDHIDTTASSAPGPRLGPKGVKPGVRPVTARSLWHEEAAVVPPSATAAPALAARPDGAAPRSAAPWIVGAGVCIALVGLAVVTSRNLSGPQPLPAAAVVGQVEPSPQEAQLQSAPPAAGADVVAAEAAPTLPAPLAEAPRAAPPRAEPPLPVVREAPTPAVKAPTPGPEALAQARPHEPALQPLAPPVVTPEQAPPQAAPVVPPVAQQTPPAAPDVEDGGITAKVRLALAADATLAALPIAVSTEHGVVRLEGQAPDAQVRERATLVAAATTGVKAVDNRLTLPPLAAHQAAGNGG